MLFAGFILQHRYAQSEHYRSGYLIIRLPECVMQISPRVGFVAENATLVGNLTLDALVSIWFQAVLRADNAPIAVGKGSNIQDGCICHTDPGIPLKIGQYVSVGHSAVLHGCEIGDFSLIGIHAVVLNRAQIGKHCLIGANALVTEGMHIPDASVVMGSPAKIVRSLSTVERERIQSGAKAYIREAERYQRLQNAQIPVSE